MTATEITIIEVGGDRWDTDVHDSLINDTTALQAAIAGELALVNPTAYNIDWKPGDHLPTLSGSVVYASGEWICNLTDAVPVGTGTADQRLPNDAAGFLIHTCDADGRTVEITAWYEREPNSDMVAQHTGNFGGAIERLSDGAWNHGNGWK